MRTIFQFPSLISIMTLVALILLAYFSAKKLGFGGIILGCFISFVLLLLVDVAQLQGAQQGGGGFSALIFLFFQMASALVATVFLLPISIFGLRKKIIVAEKGLSFQSSWRRVIFFSLVPVLICSLWMGFQNSIEKGDIKYGIMGVLVYAPSGYVVMGVQSILFAIAMEWYGLRVSIIKEQAFPYFLTAVIGGGIAGLSLMLTPLFVFDSLSYWVSYGILGGLVTAAIAWQVFSLSRLVKNIESGVGT